MTTFVLLNLFAFQAIFLSCKIYLLSKGHLVCHHLVFKNTQRVLGTCSKQSNENSSESSECHFLILLDSTRSKNFFQEKISVKRVESSKMATLGMAPLAPPAPTARLTLSHAGTTYFQSTFWHGRMKSS